MKTACLIGINVNIPDTKVRKLELLIFLVSESKEPSNSFKSALPFYRWIIRCSEKSDFPSVIQLISYNTGLLIQVFCVPVQSSVHWLTLPPEASFHLLKCSRQTYMAIGYHQSFQCKRAITQQEATQGWSSGTFSLPHSSSLKSHKIKGLWGSWPWAFQGPLTWEVPWFLFEN